MSRIVLAVCFGAVLGTLFAAPAMTESNRQRAAVAFQVGLSAIARGEFIRARGAFERALKLGALGAGYNLGLMYNLGWGVKVDRRRACDYYEIASRSRMPKPMHNLGTCFYAGHGRPKDYRKAATWYRRAAAVGHVRSYCALGNMVRKGKGFQRNVKRGIALCRKAAEAGDADAKADLGTIYLRGEGVPVDHGRAAHWLSAAARQGQPNAQYLHALQLWNGDGVTQNRGRSACWLRAAALRGQRNAPLPLGAYYYTKSFNTKTKRLFTDPSTKAVMWLLFATRIDPKASSRKKARFLARKLLDIEPGLLARAQVEYKKTRKRVVPIGGPRRFTPINCP